MPAAHAAAKTDAPAPKAYVGDMKNHVTKYEDTLPEIARRNDIGFNELRSANPYVDPWMPGAGVKMVIPNRHILPDAVHKGIVINLPEMRMYIYGSDGRFIVTHPIGIGREGLMTPIGQTTIVRKVVGPIWRPTPRMLKEHPELKPEVGPGPDNPMGTHAMYLGWPQYAIHGTDKPYAIGRRASSGCIRMYPEDIKATYPLVPVGETVTVVNEPVKAAWINNRMYIEAHPPLDQAMMIEEEGGHPYYDMTDDDMREILRVAGDKDDLIDWVKVRAAIRAREGYPVPVSDNAGVDRDVAANAAPDDGDDAPAVADSPEAPESAPAKAPEGGSMPVKEESAGKKQLDVKQADAKQVDEKQVDEKPAEKANGVKDDDAKAVDMAPAAATPAVTAADASKVAAAAAKAASAQESAPAPAGKTPVKKAGAGKAAVKKTVRKKAAAAAPGPAPVKPLRRPLRRQEPVLDDPSDATPPAPSNSPGDEGARQPVYN